MHLLSALAHLHAGLGVTAHGLFTGALALLAGDNRMGASLHRLLTSDGGLSARLLALLTGDGGLGAGGFSLGADLLCGGDMTAGIGARDFSLTARFAGLNPSLPRALTGGVGLGALLGRGVLVIIVANAAG